VDLGAGFVAGRLTTSTFAAVRRGSDSHFTIADTASMARSRDVSEQERLDRIDRHLQQLSAASTALQQELTIARQLAAERQRATRTHITPASTPRKKQRRR
jgi:hypothetical protein